MGNPLGIKGLTISIQVLNNEISLVIPFSFEFTIKKLKMLSWCNFFLDYHFKMLPEVEIWGQLKQYEQVLNRQALKCREEYGQHTWRTPTLNVSIDKRHAWFLTWIFRKKGVAYTWSFIVIILCYYQAISKFACKTLALDSLFVDILTYVIKTLLCTSAWRILKSGGRRDDESKFLWLETKKHCHKSLGHKI